MAEHRITDFVDQAAIDRLKELNTEMQTIKVTYVEVANALLKGLSIKVSGITDVDAALQSLVELQRRASANTQQLTRNMAEHGQILANTTNTISRQLMEQEKVNERTRTAYTRQKEVKEILTQAVSSYGDMTKRLAEISISQDKLNERKRQEKKLYEDGKITQEQYAASLQNIIKQQQALAAEKSQLEAYTRSEAKENANSSSSYNAMSQELLRLKKAYRELDEEGRNTEIGQSMLAEIKELGAHLKDMDASMGDFQRNVGDYAIACNNGVVVTDDLNRVLGLQAGTIAGCIEQNKSLQDAKTKLNTADVNYASTLDAINTKIAENNQRISDVSAIMGKSATSIAEAEEQNKLLSEALKLIDVTAKGASDKIKAINAKIDENNKLIQDNSTKQQSIKRDLKELVLEIANLTIQYQSLSEEERNSADGKALAEHIQGLTERAGVLKDAIADTNMAISNAASDTRGFDQISEGIGLMINGFGLATGAAEMLGISQGELVEIQTKLQASIVAANALTQMQTKLQKQSALMQGIATVQTKAATLAENIKTAAVGKGTIATKAATAAQWLLNKAAMANPYVLLAMAIGTVVGALAIFVSSSSAAKEAQKSLNKEIERTNKGIQRISDECDFNVGIAKACGESEDAIRSMRLEAARAANDLAYLNLQKVMHDPNHTKEQYEEAARMEEETYQKVKQILDEGTFAYLKSLNDKEKAEEKAKEDAAKRAAEAYKRAKSAQAIEQDMLKMRLTSLKLQAQAADEFSDEWVALMEQIAQTNNSIKVFDVKEQLANALKEAETSYKVGKIKAEEYNQIIEELKRNANGHLLALDMELSNDLDEIQDKAAKHSYEVAKANIANRLSVVRKGSKEEYDLKLRHLKIEYMQEVSEANGTGIGILAIQEKYEKLKRDLAEEYASNRIRDIQDRVAAETVIAENAYSQQLADLKAKYAEELAAAGDNAQKRAEISKKYEDNVAKATEHYAQSKAQAQIAMIEEMLGVEDLSADERARLETELAKAKIDLEDAIADAAIASNKRIVDADNEATQKRMENVRMWLQKAGEALNAINELASTIYGARIAHIEEEIEANEKRADEAQEQAEAENDLITELVEKKVISQEEGEARKRAAEALSAQKHKQIELRKQELEKQKAALEHRQAVWEKANSIAQAGIATALAITQALPNIPLVALVSALGALQMATILATPIPKYKSGTDYHKGGLAIVGDGGKAEVVFSNGEYYVTPDSPTLVDIPQGAKVYPDADRFIDGSVGINPHILVAGSREGSSFNVDFSRLERKIEGSNELLRSIAYQQKGQGKALADALYRSDFEQFKLTKL